MAKPYYCPFSVKSSAEGSDPIPCPAKNEDAIWKCPLAIDDKECAFKVLAEALK